MSVTALFYLVAYAFGLCKALAGRPVWGMYVYFLCFYMHAPSQWWGQSLPSIRWALLASVVTLVSLLIYPPKRGFRFWQFRENKWLSLLFIFTLIQYPFVINSNIHGDYVFLLLKFILFIFLLQNTVFTLSDVKKILWVNLFGGAYLAYMGMSMHSGGRLEGIGTPGMESANQLGQHFAIILLMGGYLLIEKFNKSHVFVAFALSLILMALFMTESRGVIAALAASGLLGIYFVPDGKRKKIMSFGLLAAIACLMLMGPQIIERFKGMEKDNMGEVKDRSAGSRMVILNAQWEMFKKSPFIGHGHRGTLLLSNQFMSSEYLTTSGGGNVAVRASHNVAASFFVDHGAVGAFLYFMAIFSCAWRIWSVRKKINHIDPSMQEECRGLASLLTGCVIALTCFILSGMGSNNKKLEGDIWIMAIAPVLFYRMNRISTKNERQLLLKKGDEQ